MIIKANMNIMILFIFLLISFRSIVGFRYVYFYERVIENQNLLDKLGVFGSFTALPNLREHYHKVSHKFEKKSKKSERFFLTNKNRCGILSENQYPLHRFLTQRQRYTTTHNKYTPKLQFGPSFRDSFTFMLEKEFRNEDLSGKIIAFGHERSLRFT